MDSVVDKCNEDNSLKDFLMKIQKVKLQKFIPLKNDKVCLTSVTCPKKVISPVRRCQAVEQVQQELGVSERRACRVIGQPRSTQRYNQQTVDDEELLTKRMVELASEYSRYGYRRVTAMLRNEGWLVNHKRVARLWRREGLKIPQKQPKRGRLSRKASGCYSSTMAQSFA